MGAPGWERDLERWLEPFLVRLSRQAQRRWAPVYLQGLLLPGERKSVEPMAHRVAPGDVQQLHHFVSTSPWATAPLEDELVRQAERLVGGPDAVLVIDDTALVKQGRHSVGVQRQYCGQLGKRANCQALVSLTLADGEVPVGVGLRLFLPECWSADPARCRRAGVPEAIGHRPKWRIALDEIDRVIAAGASFGCVLADAEYGKAVKFRQGLSERQLRWAVGIMPAQQVYPIDVTLRAAAPTPRGGRPAKHPVPSHRRFARSRGGAGRRGRCGRRSRPCGCGSPTGRRWRATAACPGPRRGWSVNAAPVASGSITSPITRPERRGSGW
jgi:SRSO17 transposase